MYLPTRIRQLVNQGLGKLGGGMWTRPIALYSIQSILTISRKEGRRDNGPSRLWGRLIETQGFRSRTSQGGMVRSPRVRFGVAL
jgi:hypothetical protein